MIGVEVQKQGDQWVAIYQETIVASATTISGLIRRVEQWKREAKQ